MVKRGKKETKSDIIKEEKIDSGEEKEFEKEKSEGVEEKEVTEKGEEKKQANPLRTLLLLIIVLLIIDIVFMAYYYKWDVSGYLNSIKQKFTTGKVIENQTPEGEKCSDGTPYGKCAAEKPYYCYEGQLLKSANACGCPEGYVVDFQDCKKI